jgi:AmmeMemoRadiSam system protein A
MNDHDIPNPGDAAEAAGMGRLSGPGVTINPDRATRCTLLAFSRDLLAWRLRRAGGADAITGGRPARTGISEPELPPGLPILDATPGLFVTLRIRGDLRGCIGAIITERPLRDTLRRVTLEAAFEDHRFRPLALEELPHCTIEHSLLTVPVPVADPEEITIGSDGMILTVGRRRALFLPEVATEQGWDLPQTLGFLARKAGLPVDAWRDPAARFEVFRTVHYGEAECL